MSQTAMGPAEPYQDHMLLAGIGVVGECGETLRHGLCSGASAPTFLQDTALVTLDAQGFLGGSKASLRRSVRPTTRRSCAIPPGCGGTRGVGP